MPEWRKNAVHPLEITGYTAEGLGVAFTMESYRREHDYPHPVSYFRVGNPDFSLSWNLMWREDAFRSSYMDEFIQLLKQLA